MSRKLSDVVRLAKERLGEQPDEEKSKSPSLEHYIQRRSGPRGLSSVDNLLGRSDPQGAETRLFGNEGTTDYFLHGIRRLRENVSKQPPVNIPGRLLWRQVLDEQHGIESIKISELETEYSMNPSSVESALLGLLFTNHVQCYPGLDGIPHLKIMPLLELDMIMEEPGQRLNPFIVVGGAGTGKTHFISALGDSLQSVMPHRSIFRIDGTTLGEVPSDCEEVFRQAWCNISR